MFHKKPDPAVQRAAAEQIAALYPDAAAAELPAEEFRIRWLNAFAPDMPFAEAKSFCLPRHMYENHLWHAFSFERTDCYMGDVAREAFSDGIDGACFLYLDGAQLLYRLPDGRALNAGALDAIANVIVTDEAFTVTYVNTGKEMTGPYFKSDDLAFETADDDEAIPEGGVDLPGAPEDAEC